MSPEQKHLKNSQESEVNLSQTTIAIRPFTRLTTALMRELELSYADIPYHNQSKHIKETVQVTALLIARCRKFNIPIDEEAVVHAAMGHDALYHLNHNYLDYPNKESLSADYLFKMLLKLGAPEEHALKVKTIIMASFHGVEPQTPEEMIMRAADLYNLGGDFKSFYENTKLLYKEAKLLNNYQGNFFSFASKALGFLSPYLLEKLELTPLFYNLEGRSTWHENAISNMIELFARCHGGREKTTIVLQYPIAGQLVDPNSSALKGNVMLIGVDEHKVDRLNFISAEKRDGQDNQLVRFALPGNKINLPIPDNSCDIIYLVRNSEIPTSEVARVLRKSGTIFYS